MGVARKWHVALLILAFVLVGAEALGDGFIIVPDPPPRPRPIPRPVYFPLSIRFHRVDAQIQGQVAETSIDQVFYNPNPVQLEGIYVFPLPEDAAVESFSMEMDGKPVQGEILDREKARGIYESIVRRLRDPALLEYVGLGAFKARVFPIPPRGEKRIQIRYRQLLHRDAGLVQYRYPLNTEKFSAEPLDQCAVRVRVQAGAPLRSIYSPSHDVEIIRKGDTEAVVSFEQKSVRPDRDFVLCFLPSAEELEMSLLTYREPGEDSYFLVILSPNPGEKEETVELKDVIFVFDTSQSMSEDRKIEQAKRALRYCLRNLHPEDRFNIVDFSTEARSFRDGLVPALENGEAALAYVDKLRARGGTDIHGALTLALSMDDHAKRPFMICFLTDGQPTIGVVDPVKLEAAVRDANPGRARIFVFGVGTDVNTHLLDRIAEQNRGTREYVIGGEDMELKLSAFFDKISSPVLSDLRIAFRDLATRDIYPRELPDLFRGSEITLLGRYSGAGSKAIALRGAYRGKAKEYVFEGRFEGGRANEFLPRLWAKRKIGFLLDQIRLHGESGELRQEVIRLSKKYGIITPYTSYLVIEEEKELAQAGRRHEGGDWFGPVVRELSRRKGETSGGGEPAGTAARGPRRISGR